MRRLLALSALLATGTGCFQFRQVLVLEPDGSGRTETTVLVMPKTSAFFRSVASEADLQDMEEHFAMRLTGAQRRELKQAGLTAVKLRGRTDDAYSLTIEGRFDRVAALSAFRAEDLPEVPFRLDHQDGGTWALEMNHRTPGPGGGAPPNPLAGLGQGGPKDADPAELFALIGGLMEEMGELQLVFDVTVPGRVVEAEPKLGLAVEGSRAVWTLGVETLFGAEWTQKLMGAMGSGGAGMPAAPSGPNPLDALDQVVVRFMPDRPLPPEAASPP